MQLGRSALVPGLLPGLVLALASCAGSQDSAVAPVAQRLLQAVEDQDGTAACAVLAPAARAELEDASGQPCAVAVLGEDVGTASSPERVEVYDLMAQVRFESGTVFLYRFAGEWLVTGAACTPRPGGEAYDCSIQVS